MNLSFINKIRRFIKRHRKFIVIALVIVVVTVVLTVGFQLLVVSPIVGLLIVAILMRGPLLHSAQGTIRTTVNINLHKTMEKYANKYSKRISNIIGESYKLDFIKIAKITDTNGNEFNLDDLGIPKEIDDNARRKTQKILVTFKDNYSRMKVRRKRLAEVIENDKPENVTKILKEYNTIIDKIDSEIKYPRTISEYKEILKVYMLRNYVRYDKSTKKYSLNPNLRSVFESLDNFYELVNKIEDKTKIHRGNIIIHLYDALHYKRLNNDDGVSKSISKLIGKTSDVLHKNYMMNIKYLINNTKLINLDYVLPVLQQSNYGIEPINYKGMKKVSKYRHLPKPPPKKFASKSDVFNIPVGKSDIEDTILD